MRDLYRVLGVSRDATARDIKSAYRRLARKHHPDVSASPDAGASFACVAEAYQILSDPARRAAYDQGYHELSVRTFYASRTAEVVAIQREFDRMVDEMLAHERQETAARTHAVLVVVPLFLSAFYVMVVKPTTIEQLSMFGRALTILLAMVGFVYLVKNLAVVLARYTYEMPDSLISVFREEKRRDKSISRRAGLVFLVCGYLVSLGLGYVVSKLFLTGFVSDLSPGAVIGVLVYPPIAVLIVGSIQRMVGLLDKG